MPIACPYCRSEIAIRDPKVGRYKVRCPKCGSKSALTVEGEAEPFRMSLAPMPGEEPPATVGEAPPEPGLEDTVVDHLANLSGDGGSSSWIRPLGDAPRRIGRFRLEGIVGDWPFRTDYLAFDPRLGRKTTLKATKPALAADPVYLSRLTREAYAAARLSHPNLAEIHDFEAQGGSLLFATERVEGTPISDLIRRAGRLDAETSVACALQAARALAFAHAQGMVHRGLRPDLLVLDNQGVVKITDLGLAGSFGTRESGAGGKSPGNAASRAESVVGVTPYSAPEVSADPTRVDGRADVYSLGCVLREMVTGVPPGGKTQGAEAPKGLAPLIARMVAERPSDRPPSMAVVVAELEGFLGKKESEGFVPRPERAAAIESAALRYVSEPAARRRRLALAGFQAVCALFCLLFLLTLNPFGALSVAALWFAANFAYLILRGVREGEEPYPTALNLIGTNRAADWWTVGLGAVLVLVLVFATNWIVPAVFLIVAAGGLAAGLYFGVDVPLAERRAPALMETKGIVRELRVQGFSEGSLRKLVARCAGGSPRELLEAVFGYDAAREETEASAGGPRFAAMLNRLTLRDAPRDWMAGLIRRRAAEADRAKLRAIEEAGFMAEGMNLVTARRRSWKTADAMIKAAADIRASAEQARRNPDAIVVTPRPVADVVREAAARPDQALNESKPEDQGPGLVVRLVETIAGARVRFLVGAALVTLCLIWAHQNGIFSAKEIEAGVRKAVETGDVAAAADVKLDVAKTDTVPLALPPLPPLVLGRFNSWAPGAAGLILIVSSFGGGLVYAAFAWAGAAIPFLGEFLPIPKIGPLDGPLAASAVGAAVLVAGMLFGRGRR